MSYNQEILEVRDDRVHDVLLVCLRIVDMAISDIYVKLFEEGSL